MSRFFQINVGDDETHVERFESNALERDNNETTETRNTSMSAEDAYTYST